MGLDRVLEFVRNHQVALITTVVSCSCLLLCWGRCCAIHCCFQ